MGFFSKIKKQYKRFKKQIKKEVKRVPANIAKHSGTIGTALSFIPGVGTVLGGAVSTLGGVLGGGGGGTLQIDPTYPQTGGTPLGQGSMGRPAPGQAFSGRPIATGSIFEQYPQFPGSTRGTGMQGILPLAIGGVLLLTLMRR